MRGKGKQFVPHGNKVMMSFPGGAGYGSPASRDKKAVIRDLALGYISADIAARDYGLAETEIKDIMQRAALGEVF